MSMDSIKSKLSRFTYALFHKCSTNEKIALDMALCCGPVPNPHLARMGTYGLSPLLKGDPSPTVGHCGLLMIKLRIKLLTIIRMFFCGGIIIRNTTTNSKHLKTTYLSWCFSHDFFSDHF